MTSSASPSHRSSEEPPGADKAKRYDRGVRIWGAHGQGALEDARICLLNCGPAGSEALKNLVLGGIHSFTIVDGKRVTQEDLGNNFLVTAEALGQSRAQCVTGEAGGRAGRAAATRLPHPRSQRLTTACPGALHRLPEGAERDRGRELRGGEPGGAHRLQPRLLPGLFAGHRRPGARGPWRCCPWASRP